MLSAPAEEPRVLNRDPVCTTPETSARSRWNGPELPQFYQKNLRNLFEFAFCFVSMV